MVLLGGKTNEVFDSKGYRYVDKEYFLCLNSWHQMPLRLFSQEYLEACGAKVLFRVKAVSEGERSKFAVNENRLAVGMLASPGSLFEEELSDIYSRDPAVVLSRFFEDEEKEHDVLCTARCPFNDDEYEDYDY